MERALKYVIDWIVEDKLKVYRAGLWLFALLACIETPLCIKVVAKLRTLVTKCRILREQMVRFQKFRYALTLFKKILQNMVRNTKSVQNSHLWVATYLRKVNVAKLSVVCS